MTPHSAGGAGPGLVISAPRTVDIWELPVPPADQLNPFEVIVRAHCSLISPGTELARWRGAVVAGREGAPAKPRFPFYPGYATVGTIAACGSRVGRVPGRRVLVAAAHRAWSVVDTRKSLCIEVPDTVNDEDATFTRLAQVGAVSLQLCQAQPGDLLAVIGLGLVGNLAGQLALSRGYRVIGFDPSPARRRAAVECGLTEVADPGDLSAQEVSSGAVSVLECSGQPAALALATRVAAIRGEIFLVGAPWTDNRDQLAGPILGSLFDRYQTLRSGWERQLPLAGATPPGSLQECDRDILRRIALGDILTKPLLSDVIAPEQAACAYQQLHEDPEHHLGVVIDWLTAKNQADPANSAIS